MVLSGVSRRCVSWPDDPGPGRLGQPCQFFQRGSVATSFRQQHADQNGGLAGDAVAAIHFLHDNEVLLEKLIGLSAVA